MRGLGLTACLAVLALAVAPAAAAQEEGEQRPPPPFVPVADDALADALESGELTEAEYALERARSVFQLARVRREFGEVTRASGRDATMIFRDLARRIGELTARERRAARSLLARPTDGSVPIGHAYSVPSEFTCGPDMCFHWVETTADAATPEWMDRVLETWESVWSQEIDALEYRAPRFDGATDQTDGPTGIDKRKLDVYVLDLGADGVFGYCAPLTGSLTPPVYCAVDNDYAEFGESETPEAFLQVTSAHEFHHASQAAYDFGDDYWLLEGTATNMEETVYGEIDDNVNFLKDWSPLSRPSSPLDRGGFFNSEYGSWIFWRYLQEKIGGDPLILREIWERADVFDPTPGAPDSGDEPPDDYSLEAVRHELAERDLGFTDVFASFATANRLLDYADAETAGYPSVPLTKTFKIDRQAPITPWRSWSISHLAARFFSFKPGQVPADARLRVATRLPNVRAAATLIVVEADGSTSSRRLKRKSGGYAGGTTRFGPGEVKRIEVVLSNGSTRMTQCWTLPGPPAYSCLGRSRDDGRVFEIRGKLLP